jgi:ATP-dependent RNA helicase DDX3X
MNGLSLKESQHAPHGHNGFERGAYIPPHLRSRGGGPQAAPPPNAAAPPPGAPGPTPEEMMNGNGFARNAEYLDSHSYTHRD